MVIVGFTNKVEDALGPFRNGLLSSRVIVGGVLSTADICMVGMTGCAVSSLGVTGLSMVTPTGREKVSNADPVKCAVNIPLIKSVDLDFDIAEDWCVSDFLAFLAS